MSNSQMVPFAQTAMPAFLQQGALTAQQVAALNGAAAIGTGGGGVNKLSLKGGKFRLNVAGQEAQVLQVFSLPLVIVRANDALTKTFYAKAYNPNAADEDQVPDCASDDGVRPRADSKLPQHQDCAGCPQNQWGSKINPQTGDKGKMCSDSKRVAIVAPNANGFYGDGDLYQLQIPAASLKDFGSYVRQLSSYSPPVPYFAVVTEISFDTNVDYPKLLFKPVRYLSEAEFAAIGKRFEEDDTKRVAGLAEAQVLRIPAQNLPALAGPSGQPPANMNQVAQQQQAQQQQAQQQQAQQQQAQQAQQPAATGWGEPVQQQQQQQQQTQQVQQQAQQPAAEAPKRKRRTKAEVEAEKQQSKPQEAQQPAGNGWGDAPTQQTQQVQQAQQPGADAWNAAASAPAATNVAQVDASNPWANAGGQQVATSGAPLQPNVIGADNPLDAVFGQANWDD